MRTSQVGEWGANKKEASCVTQKTAPDTYVGATKSLSTGKRFWCATCQTLEVVVAVQKIIQHQESADYSCTLACSHPSRLRKNDVAIGNAVQRSRSL